MATAFKKTPVVNPLTFGEKNTPDALYWKSLDVSISGSISLSLQYEEIVAHNKAYDGVDLNAKQHVLMFTFAPSKLNHIDFGDQRCSINLLTVNM